MKNIYLFFAILGILLPLLPFVVWVNKFGADPRLFLSTIINENISLIAWLDVVVSAIVLIIFIVYEGRKQSIPRLWIPIVGTLFFGVSFGLPLFLFFRELHLKNA